MTDENTGASLKGMQVGEWFGNGLNEMVNHIPILGQVKQMLELLGQSSDEAKSKVDQNTSDIASSVTSTSTNTTNSLTTMKNSHKTIMDSMVSHNKQSFDDMKNKNNTSLLAMRDSTTQTTQQMTSAWDVMRISIVDSARKIRSDSTSNFNSLGTVIGTFYRNIQSPMNWANASASAVATKFSGSGYRSWSRTPRPHSVRRVMGKHGAGLNPYTSPNKKMSLKDLMDMVGSDKEVNLSDFLSMFVDSGFGAWNFAPPHNRYIKNTADLWMTAPAYIQGIGSVGNGYQVGRFQGGTPHFTFDEFLATAESIFSVIPYKFYMDSDWKGNWVNALMSGATNCSDGTDALLALAHLFGFSGEKVHTTLKNGTGHFYAMINGRALDTTNFQHRGSWSPLGGAGIPPRSHSVGNNTTHNITIDMSNSNFYGEDDFKEQLRQASREVLREEFNDPFTIAL